MPNLLRYRGQTAERFIRAAVREEQVRLLYRQLPMSLVLSLLVIPLVGAVLWGVLPVNAVGYWLLAFLLVTLVRALVLFMFWRSQEERRDYRLWFWLNLATTGLAGLVTGAAGLVTLGVGDFQAIGFLLVVFAGLSAGALSTNGSSFGTVLAYTLPLVAPTGLGLMAQDSDLLRALGVLALIFVLGSSLAARRYNGVLVDALRLRFRNNALYRQTVRSNQKARISTQALQDQVAQREQAERHTAAYAERLQKANLALRREIEERERNEQLLTQQAISILESEEQMRAVFHNAFDAIITCTAQGTILSANPAAETLFASRLEQLKGRQIQDLIPGFSALAATHKVIEAEGLRADGTPMPLAFSMDPMQVGRQVQYVCILRDETQARAARRALIDAKEAAERANRAKSEFLSSMSHELRTPLNAILGFAQLLQTDPEAPLTDNQQESLEHIAAGGWHLLKLINDILDLAKIEAGRMETLPEDLALGEMIEESVRMITRDAERRQVKLENRADNPGPVVRADRVRLKQVLLNLLSNAIKYNRPGGRVTVEPAAAQDGRCRLVVADTGRGLTPEQIEVIFAPFTRVADNKEEIEGTGIGLTITQRLLEMMDGHIGVESEPGQGSRFWIDLPLAEMPVPMTPQTKVTTTPGDAEVILGTGYRVLYVEDNLANLKLVQGVVHRRRPQVELLSAADGPQGLELARRTRPDLVLLDISLPGMSGFEVLRALREDPRTAAIPAVALSANAMPADIQAGLEAGFLDYLTKPVNMDHLLRTLDAILVRARAWPPGPG